MEKKNNAGLWNEARRVAVGLAVAFGIVALVGSAVFYFFPTFLSSPGLNWKVLENESVSVYYLKEDLPKSNVESLLARITKSKKRIITELGIEEGEVPDRIRVYLHKDLGALRSAIADRKNATGIDIPLAIMDVLAGYDFEPVLVRLLTIFSWGRPSSEFLRIGLQSFFSDRIDRPNLRVEALESLAFSLEEIFYLEKAGSLPRTLHDKIYDSFDSPNAPGGMSLGQLSSLIRFEEDTSPFEYELMVESTSFVSYVLESYGPLALQVMWEADSLREAVEQALGLSMKRVEENWLEFVEDRSKDDSLQNYYRGRSLFSLGRLVEAESPLESIVGKEALKERSLFLLGKIAFYQGNWENARQYFSSLGNQKTLSPERETQLNAYQKLLRCYRPGKKWQFGKLVVFAPESKEEFQNTVESVEKVLQRVKREIPSLLGNYSRLGIFVYKGGDISDAWKRIDIPEWVAVSSATDSLPLLGAELVVRRLSRTPTYSNLLRRGLIHYLADGLVFRSAKRVLAEGKWEPLNGISVGLDPSSSSSKIAGAFVGYLLSQYEPEKFTKLWELTTPLGGDRSLEASLKVVGNKGLSQVEMGLKEFLRTYEGGTREGKS